MKKLYTYSLLAIAAAALSFSCVKSTVEAPVQEEPVGETVTVSCTFAQPDTKVAINDANGKTTWEVGDQILIHGKATSEDVTVTLAAGNISADGKIATFSVTLPATPYLDEDTTNPNGYYAAYPASAYMENSSGRGYHYNTFSETNLPLLSASYDSANKQFTFHNLCGILSFKVTGSFDSYIFKGNSGETVGYDKYAVKTIYGQSPNYNHSSTASPKTSITGSVDGSGANPNLICLPNGATFSSGFKLILLNSGTPVKQLVYDGSATVDRNKYRPMGDITAKLEDYVPDTPPATNHYHNSSIAIGTATPLDATASANCYIVSAAGSYKFKAVQGNDTTEELTTIASVGILWETYNTSTDITVNTLISAVDYDYSSGNTPYIVFSTPGALNHGNAVIFAKDDHNDIIWSWHIWIPTDAVSSADYTSIIGGQMMNMNLGALEEVPGSGAPTFESIGLLYQWGRKDPFVGVSEWAKHPSTAKVAGTSWTASKVQVSIDRAIQNPTVYYYNGSDSGNWCSTASSTLWNNSGAKTKYDPCPPGYKVPVNTGSIWTQTDTGWTFDLTNHVCVFSDIRIPLSGYIESYGGTLFGSDEEDHAYIWSASSYDDAKANCVYIRAYNDSNKYYKSYRGKANAGNVRCVTE